MTDCIRVLIADDHPVVREGLRGLIASEPGMLVAGEAADGIEAVRMARQLRPNVVLLDLVMPRMDGITAIAEITAECPGVAILVITSFGDDEKLFSALKAGASGYLLKDSSPTLLLDGIRSVARGEASLHPSLARKVIRGLNSSTATAAPRSADALTERERQILECIAQGCSNKAIAEKLYLSERTVRSYVSNILRTLRLSNRTQAALYAVQQGLNGQQAKGQRH